MLPTEGAACHIPINCWLINSSGFSEVPGKFLDVAIGEFVGKLDVAKGISVGKSLDVAKVYLLANPLICNRFISSIVSITRTHNSQNYAYIQNKHYLTQSSKIITFALL